MAADLHIHSAGSVTEDDLACFKSHALGSKWFNPQHQCGGVSCSCEHWDRVADSPSIWIGEVSWLKAALVGDDETFVPSPVQKISELIGENLPVLDNELRSQLLSALGLDNTTSYTIAEHAKVAAWLDEHMGERLFTVSW
jgi:hypothetical protein